MKGRFLAIAAGLAVVWVWELTEGGIYIFDHVVHPGFVGYIALLFCALPVVTHGDDSRSLRLWLFLASLTISDLAVMTTRGTPEASLIRDLAIGLTLALLVLLPLALLKRPQASQADLRWYHALAITGEAFVAVAIFQLANRSARAAGVPNEDRSLMLGDVEVHHLNWGVLLLVAAVLVIGAVAKHRVALGLTLVVMGFGHGMVLDQWLYCAAPVVTDDLYFAPETWLSALILGLLVLATWLYWIRCRRSRTSF